MKKLVPEKLRVKILIRDKFECQECGKFSYIKYNRWKKYSGHEIHHVFSNDNVEYDNLITLCKKCHLAAHDGDWKKKPIKFYNPDEMPDCAEMLSYYHMNLWFIKLSFRYGNIVSSVVKSREAEQPTE